MDPEWVRAVNGVLAGVGLLLTLWRARTFWAAYSPTLRLMAFATGALLFTGCYGSFEALNQNAPLGLRTYMAGAAYLWVVVALTVAFHPPRPR